MCIVTLHFLSTSLHPPLSYFLYIFLSLYLSLSLSISLSLSVTQSISFSYSISVHVNVRLFISVSTYLHYCRLPYILIAFTMYVRLSVSTLDNSTSFTQNYIFNCFFFLFSSVRSRIIRRTLPLRWIFRKTLYLFLSKFRITLQDQVQCWKLKEESGDEINMYGDR